MKNGAKNGKKKVLTNEDLARKIDQLGASVARRVDVEALSKQIELVATSVADLNERADKSEMNHDKLEALVKSEVKGVEARLGQKIDHITNRLDDVVLNYEKKESHQRDLQKVSRRVAVVEHKVASIK